MRKKIFVTEDAFKRLVGNMSKSIIKEDYAWWGDTKPLEQIMMLADGIVQHYQEDDDDFDPERRATYDIVEWAKKVRDQAEDFIHCNAHNVSINGGENW